MSHFYGRIQGDRGEATRTGSKGSGIRATINSWNNEVYAHLGADNEGKDELSLTIPKELNTTINGTKVRLTPDPRLMFEDEEEYVRATMKPDQRVVNKPIPVTKYKRGRSVVRQHRRTKPKR